MASVIGRVAAVFTASTSGLTSGVNRATASMDRMQRSVTSLRSGLSTLTAIQGAQLFGSMAAAASRAVGSMISMAQAQAEVIDSTSKMAARLGMTYGELAGLSLAGELAGVGMDTIANAATKADLAFVKAANGSKMARDAFASIGLSVEQLNGLSSAERFQAIATAIASLPTEAERAAAAVRIFGRSGAALLPLFSGGADGIAQATAEAQRFGLAMTNVQGRNVEAMNDAFTRAQQAIAGVVSQVVAYLAPAIEAVTTTFSDFIGSVGGANIGQAVGDAIISAASFFAGVVDDFIARSGGVWEYASAVATQWAGTWDVAKSVGALLLGVGSAIKAALASTMLGIVTPIAAILSAVQKAAAMVYMSSGTLDQSVAGLDAMVVSLGADMEAAGSSMADSFASAFGATDQAGGAGAPGPMATMIEQARQAAREAANARDVATRTPLSVQSATGPAQSTAALKATDSTSREGIAEMFRIMRGDTGTIQEEQLAALESIAASVEQMAADGGGDFTEAVIPAF